MRNLIAAVWLMLLVLPGLSDRAFSDEAADKPVAKPSAKQPAVPPTVSRLFPPGGQRGRSVDVQLAGAAGTPAGVFWTDHGQLTVQLASDGKSAVVTVPPDATPGLHWLRCHNAAGAGPRLPFLVGVIPEITESEPNDRVSTGTRLPGSAHTINGTLSKSGDVDVYAVSLQAGQTLVCSLMASQTLNSPVDAVLQIVDRSGTVLAHNDDDHRLDPELVFTASAADEYFVRVFGFPSSPNSTIRLAGAATYVYRLTVTTEAFVDYASPPSVDGALESRVWLTGWNIPADRQQIVVSPLRPDSFVVDDLSVPVAIGRSAVPSYAEAEVTALGQPLTVPADIAGVISERGEQDEYVITAAKGDKLEISVSAFAEHSALDAVLSLLDANGKVVKSADDLARDNFDARLAVTIATQGTYRAQIADRYQTGSPQHFYRLSVRPLLPAITASVAADAFVLSPDQPLEIPVTISRANGHAAAVTWMVRGLPEGVTCAAVVSEPKGDSAKKVVLKLSAAADRPPTAFGGLIQITSQEQPGVMATTTLPAGNGTTGDLWLTIPAP